VRESAQGAMVGKLKAVGLRTGLILAGWLCTAITGILPAILAARDADLELIKRAETAYEIVTIWAVYRLGARLLRLPLPGRVMRVVLNLAWAVFGYVIVGGTVEILIGHPTLAAGVAGLSFAIVLYLLLARQVKVDEVPRKEGR